MEIAYAHDLCTMHGNARALARLDHYIHHHDHHHTKTAETGGMLCGVELRYFWPCDCVAVCVSVCALCTPENRSLRRYAIAINRHTKIKHKCNDDNTEHRHSECVSTQHLPQCIV